MLSKLLERNGACGSMVVCLALGFTVGCASLPGSKTTQGAVVGGLVGAGSGAAIGRHGHDTAGILIGTAVGAVAGGVIGHYLDNQSQEIGQIPDATVTQQQDRLVVTFPGDVLFNSGSATLSGGAQQRLSSIAQTLNRYPESNLVVRGHTDSTGSTALNDRLSQDRAESVRNYLISQGVAGNRITATGMGAQYPVTSNANEAGRQQNRRVEIEIIPNQQQLQQQQGHPN
ncbi:MAG: OmpA family protein [Proteobacteria bacterium]|nr:OmpA family protein [Pseudomonadota bacterium]